MFDRFTDRAKQAVMSSQDEAMSLGHDFIGTEHILLGLAATGDSTAGAVLTAHGVDLSRARDETVRLLKAAGVESNGGEAARDALSSIGIDVDEIKRRADDTFGPGAFTFPRPAYTPAAKKALELTVGEALSRGQEHIGTEHMLLGLLAEGEGVAIGVLTALRVETAVLRSAVLDRIPPQST